MSISPFGRDNVIWYVGYLHVIKPRKIAQKHQPTPYHSLLFPNMQLGIDAKRCGIVVKANSGVSIRLQSYGTLWRLRIKTPVVTSSAQRRVIPYMNCRVKGLIITSEWESGTGLQETRCFDLTGGDHPRTTILTLPIPHLDSGLCLSMELEKPWIQERKS